MLAFLDEMADQLDKNATKNGDFHNIPAPKNHLKNILRKIAINKWQHKWTTGETGRPVFNIIPKVSTNPVSWSREQILFTTGHGAFPNYLKWFKLHNSDLCACGKIGTPFHFATFCHLTSAFQFTKTREDLTSILWQNLLDNKLSRLKISRLMSFLIEHEDLNKFQQDQNKVTNSDSSSDSETVSLHPTSQHV
ncbi:hypothetical protein AVEN_94268-1 [Araneus ventricosus]|uniref:Reverse transcriptase zinc-binding domain-containing protein n=1 Tax=Araneus ventricosus TaxID=182803 RepID=A0A4Y2PYB9_ARAVE|nr:hypothetical protein AVEN_94268-1 [Araneus ventricosus]